jgi:amino acid transporter
MEGTTADGVAPGAVTVAETELQAGALRLPGIMMQAITHIAPGLNVLLGLVFIVSFAGIIAPLAYFVGGVICLLVAIVLTQLAKHFNGAGGYFTYVSKTINPRTGWLTAWTYFLYDPVAVAAVCAFTAALLNNTFKAQYGWGIPWWVTFLVLVAIVNASTLFGVALSAQLMLVLGLLEMLIFLGLAISGLVSPGAGGVNFHSFNPSNGTTYHGFYLAVVFTILALSGFESVAPLAEESENPRRNLPIAIVGSTIIVAVFYLFVNWGILVGAGTANLTHFQALPDPIFELARRLWGGAWLLVLFAAVNSALAVSIAIQNASTRVFFGMGRAGALPHALGKVHPRWKTPWNAIWLELAITLILGFGLSFWFGATGQFGFIGTFQTLGLVLVYSAGNIGCMLWYWRSRRSEFNWLLHGFIPIASSAAMLWVAYKTIEGAHLLHPKSFTDYPFWVALGWIVLGLVIMLVASRTGREEWLLRAAEAAHERAETKEELSEHHALI